MLHFLQSMDTARRSTSSPSLNMFHDIVICVLAPYLVELIRYTEAKKQAVSWCVVHLLLSRLKAHSWLALATQLMHRAASHDDVFWRLYQN